MSPILKVVGLAAGLPIVVACVRFHPKPIAPVKAMEDFEARRLDASELRDFLLRNQDAKDWPPAAWDLKSLTLAAFYYHPDMDVARPNGVSPGAAGSPRANGPIRP